MKCYFLSLTFILACTVITNYLVDPAYRWHNRINQFSKVDEWKKDQVLILPDNFDERLFRKAQLKKIDRPDILALGSSRVMLVDKDMFNSNVSFFNAGLSNASVEDYIGIWQILKDLKKIPKSIILFMDPWIINRSAVDRTNWISNFEQYTKFLAEQKITSFTLLDFYRELKKQWITDYFDLFSFSILRQSIQNLVDVKTNDQKIFLYSSRLYDGNQAAWLFDGSHVYKRDRMIPNHELFESGTDENNNYFKELRKWGLDKRYLDLLLSLLKDMKAYNVSVFIVVPPFCPEFFEKLVQEPAYLQFKNQFFGELEKIETTGLAREVCNVFDSKSFGCNKDLDFIDYLHMRKPCVVKALHHCFDSKSKLSSLLGREEVRWF